MLALNVDSTHYWRGRTPGQSESTEIRRGFHCHPKLLHRSQAKYDDDGSGQIEAEELMGIMKYLGVNVTEKEVHEMVLEIDEDGSGTIDFDEFKAMVKKVGHWLRLLERLSICRRIETQKICCAPTGNGRRFWSGFLCFGDGTGPAFVQCNRR